MSASGTVGAIKSAYKAGKFQQPTLPHLTPQPIPVVPAVTVGQLGVTVMGAWQLGR